MYSDDILKAIKQIAIDAVDAQKPLTVSYGTVITADPLEVQLSQRLIIDKDFLVIPAEHMDMSAGDKLILLRAFEGRYYIVLGRIGEKRESDIQAITNAEIDEIMEE